MKKINSVNDITSGMLVTLRNGSKMTVVTTTIYGNMDKCCTGLSLFAPAVGEDGKDEYWPLSEYDSEFKCKHSFLNGIFEEYDLSDALKLPLPDLDIVQVWSCTCPSNAFANTTKDRELLWSDPSYKAKTWDELTEEEKDAECCKYDDCRDCPHNNKGCGDPEDEDEEEDEDDKAKADALLDELREECKDNPLASLTFKALSDGLPKGHADYILGKTDKNPERKAAGHGDKSLAEQLYEKDKELAAEGVSVLERDIALLTAMRSACGDEKG